MMKTRCLNMRICGKVIWLLLKYTYVRHWCHPYIESTDSLIYVHIHMCIYIYTCYMYIYIIMYMQEDSKLQAEVVAKDTQPQQKDGQLEERDSQIRQ